jgi:hypothetical protein
VADLKHYAIRGGIEGRERRRILARVMRASSTSLFDRLGLYDGLACLDVGCGGGDVTLELARRVASRVGPSAPTSTKPSWSSPATRPSNKALPTWNSVCQMSGKFPAHLSSTSCMRDSSSRT